MSRYLKISTVAPQPPPGNPGTSQAAVDEMIEFWKGRLGQVLPDRPDLLLVPEACDRYPAHDLRYREPLAPAQGGCHARGTRYRCGSIAPTAAPRTLALQETA